MIITIKEEFFERLRDDFESMAIIDPELKSKSIEFTKMADEISLIDPVEHQSYVDQKIADYIFSKYKFVQVKDHVLMGEDKRVLIHVA